MTSLAFFQSHNKGGDLPCHCHETKALICHCAPCQENMPAEEINKTQTSFSKKEPQCIEVSRSNRQNVPLIGFSSWLTEMVAEFLLPRQLVKLFFLSPSFSSEKTMKLPPHGTKRKAFYYACLSNRLSTKQVFCLQ